MTKPNLIFLLISFLCVSIGNAQIYFDKTFDVSNNLEFGWTVTITPDSNYLTLSNGTDVYTFNGTYTLSSFTQEGIIFNNKSYLTLNHFAYVGLTNTLFALPNQSAYMFGGSLEDELTGDSDNMLVKFDSNGDTLFQRVYIDSDFSAPYYSTLTSDNKVLLAGFIGPYLDPKDVFLMKTDTNGNILWKKIYGDSEEDLGFRVLENQYSEYVIAAVKIYGNNANPWIIETDTAGNIIKEEEFLEPFYPCAMMLIPTLDNKMLFLSCADTIVNNFDYERPAILGKIDTNFDFVWLTIFNYPLDNGLYIAKQLADSNIVYVGFQEGGNPNAPEGWIGKLDKYGNKIWEHQYRHDNSLWNYFSDFQQTYDKGFIITGSSDGPTGQDLWLVKLDSLGCLEPCFTNIGTIETGAKSTSLQVYPNPCSIRTSILYNVPDNAQQVTTSITDLTGKVLLRIPVDSYSNSYDLDVRNFDQGVFICSLYIDQKLERNIKVIVTR